MSIAIVAVAALSIAGTSTAGQNGRRPFVEKIPGTLVSFEMAPLPDGEIMVRGTKHTIKGLWMGATEVTWDLYDIFAFKLDIPEERHSEIGTDARPTKPYGAPDRGFGHAGYPAIGVSWDAARIFCVWLSEKTGKRYRLPTEAEWEYAARAPATVNGRPATLDEVAWHWDNADDATHPVGKKRPNDWGLYDLLGNVGEWVVASGRARMLAGGSFMDKPTDVHAAARKEQADWWQQTDPQMPKSKWWLTDAPFAGFRVVCEGPTPLSASEDRVQ